MHRRRHRHRADRPVGFERRQLDVGHVGGTKAAAHSGRAWTPDAAMALATPPGSQRATSGPRTRARRRRRWPPTPPPPTRRRSGCAAAPRGPCRRCPTVRRPAACRERYGQPRRSPGGRLRPAPHVGKCGEECARRHGGCHDDAGSGDGGQLGRDRPQALGRLRGLQGRSTRRANQLTSARRGGA